MRFCLQSFFLVLFGIVIASSRPATAAPKLTTQFAHTQGVNAVALSRDRSLMATGSYDNSVRLWRVKSGQLIRTFSGHSGRVNAVAINPSATRIVSGDSNGKIILWDLLTGDIIGRFKGGAGKGNNIVHSVAFTSDGDQFLAADNKRIRIRNIDSGRRVRDFSLRGYDGPSETVLSPDGAWVVSGTMFGSVIAWDRKTGRQKFRIKAHKNTISRLAVSPDKRFLATSGSGDKSVKIWRLPKPSLVRTLKGFTGYQISLAFSSDSALLYTGDWNYASKPRTKSRPFNTVKAWNLKTGRVVRTLKEVWGPKDSIVGSYRLALLDDGRLVTGGGSGETKLWDLARGEPIRSFGIRTSILSVKALPDGRHLMAGSGMTPALWDIQEGRLVREYPGHEHYVTALAISADGRRMVTGSWANQLMAWEIATGKAAKWPQKHSAAIASIAISPDGSRTATGDWSGSLRLWNTETGKQLKALKAHSNGVKELAFASEGQSLISGGADDYLKVWTVGKGRIRRNIKAHRNGVSALALMPDGTHAVSGGWDRTVGDGRSKPLNLWNLKSGRRIRAFDAEGTIDAVALTADGSGVLTGGNRNSVVLWDIETGQRARTFEALPAAVRSITLAPDESWFAVSLADGTVRVLDFDTGDLRATFVGPVDGDWLVITPEGFFAGSGNAGRMLTVVDGLKIHKVDQFYQSLYRPDLVREKLAGDPVGKVRQAAEKLDLDKVMESGAAPQVAIVSPRDGRSVTDDKLSVEAEVSDTGGGIGRMEWRVNGLTLGVHTKRGFERVAEDAANADGKSITVSQNLWLEPGKNTIEVVAYNAKNLIASEPAKITVTWDGQSSKTPPRLHVLAVGVNDYWDSRLRLAHAVTDARAISTALRQAGGDLYETVSVTNLVDDEVKAEQLEAAFKKLGQEVRPRDVFLFFLAGHGKTVDGKYYFIPQDFRYTDETSIVDKGIGQDQWQRWFSRIAARKSLLLYDTCESGSLTGDRILTRSIERIAALEKLTRAMGRTVLSAATDEAPALEGYKGHGVFTYALLDALNRSDTNKNDLIEITELAGHVDARVPEISHKAFGFRQVPQMKIVGSNFPLAKRMAALDEDGSTTVPSLIPKKPTHVVIKPSDLFAKAGGTGTAIQQLKPGTLVTLVKTEEGWVLVAREGKNLGYLASDNLLAAR